MTTFRRSTLTTPLYRGEVTEIFRGARASDGAPVLIEVLAAESASPQTVSSLRRCYSLLRELSCPRLLPAIDIEEHEGATALVFADPGVVTLRERLHAGRLDLAEALGVAAGVASALSALHARGVAHGDVRPERVVLGEGPRAVWLLGLGSPVGIASALAAEGEPSSSRAVRDAPTSTALDLAGPMDRAVDAQRDLYALGVVLYEALTGAPPFAADDPLELAHRHVARAIVPPRARAVEVPEQVSRLTQKLLAKELPVGRGFALEGRYASARSLAADLDACLAALETSGQIFSFPLGQFGAMALLGGGPEAHALHGRERERAALRDAFGRARAVRPELLVISGESGVGKTALASDLREEVRASGGRFASGKFDQTVASVPRAAISHALREIIAATIAEGPEACARLRDETLEAAGASVAVLVALFPELARLVGPQPLLPETSSAEARARFALAFHSFIRVLAPVARPLCLVIDDLHWADAASIDLIELLLTAPGDARLLVVATSRKALEDSQPALRALAARAPVSEIRLGPLERSDVRCVVAHEVGAEPDEAEALASAVFDETQGNPLFVAQILTALHDEGLLVKDLREHGYRWDIDAIRRRSASAGVVAVVTERIQRLGATARRVLALAACIGHAFDLTLLAEVASASAPEVEAALAEALEGSLVIRAGTEASGARAEFRFAHDRVQQATYALLPAGERAEVHLRIGRRLAARGVADGDDRFAVANQLNLGASCIEDPVEARALVDVNLDAGRAAMAATVHAAAAGYFGTALALLGPSGAEREPDLALALLLDRAECEVHSGAFAEASASLDAAVPRATRSADRARASGLRMVLLGALGRAEEARRVGVEALRGLGVDLLDDEEARGAEIPRRYAEARAALGGRRVQELLDAPPITDPNRRAALELLAYLAAPAYFTTPNLFTLTVLHQVTLSLQHGNASVSAYAYMLHAYTLATARGEREDAESFAALALALDERLGAGEFTCKVNFLYASFAHMRAHFREGVRYFERSRDAGLASGDLTYLSYACTHRLLGLLGLGTDLASLREEAERSITLMAQTKVASSTAAQVIVRQLVANLTGRTRGPSSLSDDDFDEGAFLEATERAKLQFPLCLYHKVKLELAVLHGPRAEARATLARATESLSGTVGFYFTTEVPFHGALVILAALDARRGTAAPPDAESETKAEVEAEAEMRALEAQIDAYAAKLAAWAESAPGNYLQKHLLVEAERARVAGDQARAMDLYDRAIEASERSGWVRDEALANELCAEFHERAGRGKVARVYWAEARAAYARWGASMKAATIAREHLGVGEATGPTRADDEHVATDALDMAAVVSTLQALTGEVVLDRLLDRFMHVVARSAGANRGLFMIDHGGRLFVEAAVTVDPDEVQVGLTMPVEDRDDLPLSVVRHVVETHEPVVLGDAVSSPRFADDPYIAARRPRSIACLCLMQKGSFKGVLYLEHAEARAVFTRARVDLLGLLSAQVAAAVESVTLYADVQVVSAQLTRANAALERKVAARTAELRSANERLALEFAERSTLQEEVLAAQEERLAELSTPLIPVTAQILVMPLIGTMDAVRTEQVLHAAIEGAHAQRARVVILDITGLRLMDEGVAHTLARVAGALELIGVEAVVTGIGAGMARQLVELGVDLAPAVTHGTLESAVVYALGRVGQALAAAPNGRARAGSACRRA
jgi:predicted ATPase/GAF domain-containing protein/serine/threonine protein kinase